MRIIVYTPLNEKNILVNSGRPDAERFHAMQRMLPVLQEFAEVRRVEAPAFEVDELYQEAVAQSIPCLFLSFTLPHQTIVGLNCPTLAVFDWAWDTMPEESWDEDPRHNWRWVFEKLAGVVTHSEYTADTVRRMAPAGFPVLTAPLPVWENYFPLQQVSNAGQRRRTLAFNRPTIDSARFNLQDLSPARWQQFQADGRFLRIDNGIGWSARQLLRHRSGSGIVSRLRRGLARAGLGHSPAVSDSAFRPDGLPDFPTRGRQALSDNLVTGDPIRQWRDCIIASYTSPPLQRLTIKGVLYTAIVNPFDSRALFYDMMTAFCRAHAECPDATLFVSLAHRDSFLRLNEYLNAVYQLQPFACRIILCVGELDNRELEQLIKATTYIVHVTRGEGQCVPLMEFMSAGKPAVAQPIGAMRDYISERVGFPFISGSEIAWWPHDPRKVLRATQARVDWDSLRLAYIESYEQFNNSYGDYAVLSANAVEQMRTLCSTKVVGPAIQEFLDNLVAQLSPRFNESAVSLENKADGLSVAADPAGVGLTDAAGNGWFNNRSGELCPQFPIGAQDTVFDLGCGIGGATLFAAAQGAHVIFADTDEEKMKALVQQVSKSPAASYRGILAEGLEIPIPDNSVSRVVAMEVLEHLDSPAQMISELARIGRPGALYLITVPDYGSEQVQKQLAPAGHFQAPNHIQVFTRSDFESLVREAGLVIESKQFTGFYWALCLCFYWATKEPQSSEAGMPTLDQIAPPFAPLLQSWAQTWKLLMDLPAGAHIRKALDELLPKSQIIIARKP